jgi:hypothetical protein
MVYICLIDIKCRNCSNLCDHYFYDSYVFGKSTVCTKCKKTTYWASRPKEVKEAIVEQLLELEPTPPKKKQSPGSNVVETY